MFEYSDIPPQVQERQKCYFFENYVKVLYRDPCQQSSQFEPTWVTERYKKDAQRIKDFAVREDDVWIVSYPKTGTTLTAEMTRILLSGLNYERIENTDIVQGVSFLELSALSKFTPEDYINRAANDSNQRIMKTHLQLNLMPGKVLTNGSHKIIYVVRDPKDAAVSFFHHHRNMHGYEGAMDDFMEDFLAGELPFGSYFRHVEEYSQFDGKLANFHLIRYEDILNEGFRVVQDVARFLNIPISCEEVMSVVDYLKFDKMKERKNSNMSLITETQKDNGRIKSDYRFMRKGKAGSFKEEMPQIFIEKFNEETRKWKQVHKLYPF